MSKADIHAESSAKKFGGKPGDYLELHEFMDSSKAGMGDNRHRAVFHHTAGIYVMQRIFGVDFEALEALREKYSLPEEFVGDLLAFLARNRERGVHLMNSSGRKVHVRDVAEQHVLEDFRNRFMPTLQDYLECMEMKSWMDNAMGPIHAGNSLQKPSGIPQPRSVSID
jgi:hypothetical protein